MNLIMLSENVVVFRLVQIRFRFVRLKFSVGRTTRKIRSGLKLPFRLKFAPFRFRFSHGVFRRGRLKMKPVFFPWVLLSKSPFWRGCPLS